MLWEGPEESDRAVEIMRLRRRIDELERKIEAQRPLTTGELLRVLGWVVTWPVHAPVRWFRGIYACARGVERVVLVLELAIVGAILAMLVSSLTMGCDAPAPPFAWDAGDSLLIKGNGLARPVVVTFCGVPATKVRINPEGTQLDMRLPDGLDPACHTIRMCNAAGCSESGWPP